MRTFVGVVAAILLVAGGLHARQRVDDSEAAIVIQNERALYAAAAKADALAFQALTLADGIWTTPSGFVPMGPLAQGLDAFELPKWTIENPRVVWSAGNCALVLYIRTGGGSYASRPFAPLMLASTLWTKRDGKWVAVHHQESEDIP